MEIESAKKEPKQGHHFNFTAKRPKPYKFDISDLKHVNQQINLRDLKLENFSGCYRANNSGNNLETLRSICEYAGVSFEVGVEPTKPNKLNSYKRAFLLINNVLVCNGFGRKERDANEMAVRIALRYLIYKGLALWNPDNIHDERSVVTKSVEEFGGENEIKQNFERLVEEFLLNPNLVAIRVDGDFSIDRATYCWQKAALVDVCNQYHLRKDIRRNFFKLSKVNSVLHKLKVFPARNNVPNNLDTAVNVQVVFHFPIQ